MQVKNSFATIVNGLSVLKLFQLSNDDLLFSQHAYSIYKVRKLKITKLGQGVRSQGTLPYLYCYYIRLTFRVCCREEGSRGCLDDGEASFRNSSPAEIVLLNFARFSIKFYNLMIFFHLNLKRTWSASDVFLIYVQELKNLGVQQIRELSQE